MVDPAPGTSSSSARTPAGRTRTAAPPSLEDALARIEALEEKVARYEQILTINPDGSVQVNAAGQLRIVSASNIYLEAGANWIELGITGIDLTAGANLKLEAAQLRFQSAMVQNASAMTENSGVVRCDTLITNTVIATTYTPGAGNVW
ncbi:MAG: hypothetical protein JNL08_21840 [Planctomycetes bacterium]|nr:hypothetical protein [Planctomycetota bacterium]